MAWKLALQSGRGVATLGCIGRKKAAGMLDDGDGASG